MTELSPVMNSEPTLTGTPVEIKLDHGVGQDCMDLSPVAGYQVGGYIRTVFLFEFYFYSWGLLRPTGFIGIFFDLQLIYYYHFTFKFTYSHSKIVRL